MVFGAATGEAAEYDDGWLFGVPQSQKGSEVRVGGDNDPLFQRGPVENLLVRRRLHIVVPDVMRFMPFFPQNVRPAATGRCL